MIPANLEPSDVSCTILGAKQAAHCQGHIVSRELPGIFGGQIKDQFFNSLPQPRYFKMLMNTSSTCLNFQVLQNSNPCITFNCTASYQCCNEAANDFLIKTLSWVVLEDVFYQQKQLYYNERPALDLFFLSLQKLLSKCR